MHKKISEDLLIDGCIEGDRYAQKMLFEKYQATMFAICMRYAKNKMEAEDVMIDGFMVVYSSLSQFKGKGSFEGWIKRIMINTAINNYRSNLKNYMSLSIDDESYFEIKDEPEHHNEEFPTDVLMGMIQSLPEGYRMVFNLYEIEGYSHKEIAKLLDVSIGTTKTQLFHAKKALQNKIAIYKQGGYQK